MSDTETLDTEAEAENGQEPYVPDLSGDSVRPLTELLNDGLLDTELDLPAKGSKPSLGFDEWFRLGENLHRITAGHQWWWGDWKLYGEKFWPEEHAHALDPHTFEPKTMSNYAYVASKIPRDKRTFDLSWSHYRVAADLVDSRQRWAALRKAEKESWTTRDLTKYVRVLQGKADPDDDDGGEDHGPKTHRTFTLSFTVHIEDVHQGEIMFNRAVELVTFESEERGVEITKLTKSEK